MLFEQYLKNCGDYNIESIKILAKKELENLIWGGSYIDISNVFQVPSYSIFITFNAYNKLLLKLEFSLSYYRDNNEFPESSHEEIITIADALKLVYIKNYLIAEYNAQNVENKTNYLKSLSDKQLELLLQLKCL